MQQNWPIRNEKMLDLSAAVCARSNAMLGFERFGYHPDQAAARHAAITGRKKFMECTVTWTGAAGTRSGMGFLAETGSGHMVAMDGAPDAAKPENGGQNLAPRPMEMLLAGTGVAPPMTWC
jgi:hypothetical protein